MSEDLRPEPPHTGTETELLLGFLDFHRATVLWKTEGLDSAALQQRLGPSSMTLGGLLKHLALVEDSWFGRTLGGRSPAPPWDTVDWEADPDWDWNSADQDSPEELRALLGAAIERSRALVGPTPDLDVVCTKQSKAGKRREFSLRWILMHMIEEYARHNGHADLLRESIDGQLGE